MADQYKTVLLFGRPGVGKGTQGKMLGAIPGFHHCASGDIFRSIDPKSETGKIFHEYSSRGELVPDDVTIKIWHESVVNRVKDKCYDPARDLLILDGIPRTVGQIQMLDGLIDVLRILHLVCPDREAMFDRLRLRAMKENRYDDSDDAVIRNRGEVYDRESAPVLDHYPEALIEEVPADGTPVQVLLHVLARIEPIQTGHFAPFDR